jgi:hypothetical protein
VTVAHVGGIAVVAYLVVVVVPFVLAYLLGRTR